MEENNIKMMIQGDLESLLEEVISKAVLKDKGLQEASERAEQAKMKNEKVFHIVDFEEPVMLSLEDCKDLIAYLLADNNLVCQELRVSYMRGLFDGMEIKQIVT